MPPISYDQAVQAMKKTGQRHYFDFGTPTKADYSPYIAKAIRQHEATLVSEIVETIDPNLLVQWMTTIMQQRADGAAVQS